jgi:hypothetical protein
MAEDVVQIVISKARALKLSAPSDLPMRVDEAAQAIKNYCNICRIPAALKYVWANIVTDQLRWEQATREVESATASDAGSSSADTILSQVKVGGTSYSFAAASSASSAQTAAIASAHGVDLDSVLMDYKAQLNKFRRIAWGW